MQPPGQSAAEGGPSVRIAVDPFMFRQRVPLTDLPALVRDLGFDAIELTPRPDFLPQYVHPRVGSEGIRAFRTALDRAGVEVVSILVLYRWSSPDESERAAAVRYWKRAIEVAGELGCARMNTDFHGRPERSEASEAQFWKSLDELLPRLEAAGITLALEPHPDDFVEDGNAAVDLVRGIDSPLVSYVYCAPHTFYMGGDMRGMLRHAGGLISHVHVADTWDHRASSGLRYLVNPPGSPVRVHQHLEIGKGEIDFEELFAGLKEIAFDGILTSAVNGFEDRAEQSCRAMRASIGALLARHGF
jgi:myo-inositol catabolism protein IolH